MPFTVSFIYKERAPLTGGSQAFSSETRDLRLDLAMHNHASLRL